MLHLKEAGSSPAATTRPDAAPADVEGARILVCAACDVPIATDADRIEIQGAHEHFHVNPQGRGFRIGCFASAANVRTSGPPVHYWTWFPSFDWQVESCAVCDTHLGWRFRGADRAFHGLILDRLRAAGK